MRGPDLLRLAAGIALLVATVTFLGALAPDRSRASAVHAAGGTAGVVAAGASATAPAACDETYPDFCISPAPPDLDCRDVGGRRFTVLPPDPHGFDRDGDGIGCER